MLSAWSGHVMQCYTVLGVVEADTHDSINSPSGHSRRVVKKRVKCKTRILVVSVCFHNTQSFLPNLMTTVS
jgi:hypothetical protein